MKRVVKVQDAIYVNNQLIANLVEDDTVRGWTAGQTIKTSSVHLIVGDMYETANTIYEVVDSQVTMPKDNWKQTMKRFLVFGGSHYYPSGGWGDYKSQHDTLDECKHPEDGWGEIYDWYHVVDTENNSIIISHYKD